MSALYIYIYINVCMQINIIIGTVSYLIIIQKY